MQKDFGIEKMQDSTTIKKSQKSSGVTMLTILFVLFTLIVGVTVGLTYSGFQSQAESSGTLTFAVNGHQGTINLSNTKITEYNSTDLTLAFTLTSDTGYTTPTISSITMGGAALTKDGNNFKSSSIVVVTYSSNTLTINRAEVTGNLVITGSSTAQTYTVTIVRNNTSYGTVSASSVANIPYNTSIVTSGATLTINGTPITASPTNATGYTTVFSGWSVPAGRITGATTITANFTRIANAYDIIYNPNGGTGTMDKTSATYGSSVSLRANTFTRTGYAFNGWNTASNGGGTTYSNGASVSNLAPSGAIILYAQWTGATYNITYSLGGGTVGSGSAVNYTFSASQQTKTVNNPTRTNYLIISWSISWTDSTHSATLPTISGTTLTIPASCYGHITLTANWKPSKIDVNISGGEYKITFFSHTRTTNGNTVLGYNRREGNYTISSGSNGMDFVNNRYVYLYVVSYTYDEPDYEATYYEDFGSITSESWIVSNGTIDWFYVNGEGDYYITIYRIDLEYYNGSTINITFNSGWDEW